MLALSLSHVLSVFLNIAVALAVFTLDVINAVQVAHHTTIYTLADRNAHIALAFLRGVLILLLVFAALDEKFRALVHSSFFLNSFMVALIIYTAVLPFSYFALRADNVNNYNLKSNVDSILIAQLPLSTYFSGVVLSYTLGNRPFTA